ncbi:MAG: adenylate kinase [Clostridia bacterium]|nr:adenylate kinase [Clostridia bacterium]
MNIILMGAPGAGKGTQSARISEKYQIPAIATGDILRGAMKAGTELGKAAKSYVDAGQLVPDSVVIGIIKEYLATDNCKNGFILDGFPRSIPQAEALDEMGVQIDVVLSIEVADEKIIERMSGRRVCSCGASYHVVYIPPKKEDVCDKCGAALYVRADDAAETVKNRLDTFHAQTEPLKEYYSKKGILVTVEGQEEVADTTALVFKALAPFEAQA